MRWNHWLGLSGVMLWVAGLPANAASKGELLVRHHFVGLAQVASRPELASLQGILALPESKRIRADVVQKLAVHMPRWFGLSLEGTDHAAGLLPWIEAALDRETHLEILESDGRVSGWALAMRADAASAGALGKGIRGVLGPRLGGGESAGEGLKWELAGKAPEGRVRFAHVGGWAVLGHGEAAFEAVTERVTGKGSAAGEAKSPLFELDAGLDKLAKLLDWSAEPAAPVPQWPGVHWIVEPRNGRLRSAAELTFAKPLGLKLGPWTIPTKWVRDPLVGFTAAQGADEWLRRLSVFTAYGVKEWPKQFFLWSVAGDAWNQYFGGPMEGPTNVIAKLALPFPKSMVTNMSWRAQVFGLRVTNKASRVEFHGLPYLLPFLESVEDAGAAHLFGGLIPQPARSVPAPSELLQQVSSRTNLVLYDWETTGRSVVWTNAPGVAGPRISTNPVGRLVQFKQLGQYWRLMMSTNSAGLAVGRDGEIWVPGGDWVQAAHPVLGDSITEVTLSAPNRLSVVRQSELGFNSLELTYLLRWMENPGFPGWSDAPYVPRGLKTLMTPPSPGGAAKP